MCEREMSLFCEHCCCCTSGFFYFLCLATLCVGIYENMKCYTVDIPSNACFLRSINITVCMSLCVFSSFIMLWPSSFKKVK